MGSGIKQLSQLVPIVGDGAIGHPDISEGRLIPVLIIDCSTHTDLYELILLHQDTPPGDVTVVWGCRRFDSKNVYLSIEFSSPLIVGIGFKFTLSKQAGLVDAIINARGVYLQPLQSGHRVLDGMGNPKIIVEIPSSATFDNWPEIHLKTAYDSYRKGGASRSQAKELAREHISRLGELWRKRQNRSNGGDKDA